jgi:hypothetical protein
VYLGVHNLVAVADERGDAMAAPTKQYHVRVSEATHRTRCAIAERSGEPMTALVERAVGLYRRERLFAEAAADWNAIHDPQARAQLDAEYALWDTTVADGLEPEEW